MHRAATYLSNQWVNKHQRSAETSTHVILNNLLILNKEQELADSGRAELSEIRNTFRQLMDTQGDVRLYPVSHGSGDKIFVQTAKGGGGIGGKQLAEHLAPLLKSNEPKNKLMISFAVCNLAQRFCLDFVREISKQIFTGPEQSKGTIFVKCRLTMMRYDEPSETGYKSKQLRAEVSDVRRRDYKGCYVSGPEAAKLGLFNCYRLEPGQRSFADELVACPGYYVAGDYLAEEQALNSAETAEKDAPASPPPAPESKPGGSHNTQETSATGEANQPRQERPKPKKFIVSRGGNRWASCEGASCL